MVTEVAAAEEDSAQNNSNPRLANGWQIVFKLDQQRTCSAKRPIGRNMRATNKFTSTQAGPLVNVPTIVVGKFGSFLWRDGPSKG